MKKNVLFFNAILTIALMFGVTLNSFAGGNLIVNGDFETEATTVPWGQYSPKGNTASAISLAPGEGVDGSLALRFSNDSIRAHRWVAGVYANFPVVLPEAKRIYDLSFKMKKENVEAMRGPIDLEISLSKNNKSKRMAYIASAVANLTSDYQTYKFSFGSPAIVDTFEVVTIMFYAGGDTVDIFIDDVSLVLKGNQLTNGGFDNEGTNLSAMGWGVWNGAGVKSSIDVVAGEGIDGSNALHVKMDTVIAHKWGHFVYWNTKAIPGAGAFKISVDMKTEPIHADSTRKPLALEVKSTGGGSVQYLYTDITLSNDYKTYEYYFGIPESRKDSALTLGFYASDDTTDFYVDNITIIGVQNDLPSVSISTSKALAYKNETIAVQIEAADDYNIKAIEYYLDNIKLKTVSAAPWIYKDTIDSDWSENETIEIKAIAIDIFGASTELKKVVGFTDCDAPVITIVADKDSVKVGETTKLTVNVSSEDMCSIVKVEFVDANGVVLSTDDSAPFEMVYGGDISSVGLVTLKAVAYDENDFKTDTVSIDVKFYIISSIIDNTVNNSLTLYPNPVSTELNIKSNNGYSVVIYNQTGQVVSEQILRGTAINVENLPKGVFMLRLLNQDNSLVGQGKFIKQ